MGFFDSLGQAASNAIDRQSKVIDGQFRRMPDAQLQQLVQKGGAVASKAAEELRRRGK